MYGPNDKWETWSSVYDQATGFYEYPYLTLHPHDSMDYTLPIYGKICDDFSKHDKLFRILTVMPKIGCKEEIETLWSDEQSVYDTQSIDSILYGPNPDKRALDPRLVKPEDRLTMDILRILGTGNDYTFDKEQMQLKIEIPIEYMRLQDYYRSTFWQYI